MTGPAVAISSPFLADGKLYLGEGFHEDKNCQLYCIDAEKGTIDVELSETDLVSRRKAWTPKPESFGSGALWRFGTTVGPARYGAVTNPGASAELRCYADI